MAEASILVAVVREWLGRGAQGRALETLLREGQLGVRVPLLPLPFPRPHSCHLPAPRSMKMTPCSGICGTVCKGIEMHDILGMVVGWAVAGPSDGRHARSKRAHPSHRHTRHHRTHRGSENAQTSVRWGREGGEDERELAQGQCFAIGTQSIGTCFSDKVVHNDTRICWGGSASKARVEERHRADPARTTSNNTQKTRYAKAQFVGTDS